MTGFSIPTDILEFDRFSQFVSQEKVNKDDLIITSERTYKHFIEPMKLDAQVIYREKYGKGEPTDEMVDAILSDLKTKTFERVIAIGGGTIIDISKVIAVSKADDCVDDLYDCSEKLKKIHPLIIIPTTCGTGSEVTNISVINRVRKGVKMGLASEAMYADKAVLIMEMLDSLPYKIFATSSIDAMVHSVESFLSPNGCSISYMFSKEALKKIIIAWKKTMDCGNKSEANEMYTNENWKKYASDFLIGSNWAGIGFGYAGCAAVHACAYPLGSVYHIPHGQSNQLMFEAVMRKYKEIQPYGRINELEKVIADCLESKVDDAMEALYSLMNQVLCCEPLHKFGIKEDELSVFSKNVINTQQRLLKNNYVNLTEEQILEIYKFAY
ncbi:iron-containing alcohol dehydrogenase [Lachnobacterium bovis]|uniref:4-hydroxybutyrate dehydrogenase n=1 Tax=Lachnobacterium bovis DSM 14045 TaxID=1122142 RepID=A0A1H3L1P8_9FIRM|nr:iron-containing alcohol dehydrogenase [Lachnobacterium bovis]SDY58437.1 4-hydroxybutyrate dehydrogenase [Lachnobacterium bovis DSM 14045]